MNLSELIFSIFVVAVIGTVLGVGVPSCMDNQRKSIIKCMEMRSTASSEECRKGFYN